MIEKSASSAAAASAAAALGKEGLTGLTAGAARAMLEKAATGFPSSPSAVTTPLPPNPGTLAVQITLSAAAVARLANKPETVNRTAYNPPGIALAQRQLLDPQMASIPLPVEQAKEQLPQGDRPIPQTAKESPTEADGEAETANPGRPDAVPASSDPAAGTTQKAQASALAERQPAPQPPMDAAKEAAAPEAPHVPATDTPPEPEPQRLTGLVAESSRPGQAVVLTPQGPLTFPIPLPAGARVEIALSNAGPVLLSILSGPVTPAADRRGDLKTGRTGNAPSPEVAADDGDADDPVLPADHRLGAALLAMGKELLSKADLPDLPSAVDGAPTVLWFGTPEHPVPLSMETVPLLDEDGDGAKGKKRRSTRFRFGLRLDGIGALQLDGMVRRQRFDLRVRTEIALESTLKQEIETIFHEALSLGGIAGSIAFAGTPGAWSQAHVMVSPVTA